jgi:hypothetical protein
LHRAAQLTIKPKLLIIIECNGHATYYTDVIPIRNLTYASNTIILKGVTCNINTISIKDRGLTLMLVRPLLPIRLTISIEHRSKTTTIIGSDPDPRALKESPVRNSNSKARS